ncbi:MAG: HEAT repeat domain-containing protein [Proteobacteria bacterium]|nr:HEAT repeat domain-containing protein [Pseudomonadota bacterium]
MRISLDSMLSEEAGKASPKGFKDGRPFGPEPDPPGAVVRPLHSVLPRPDARPPARIGAALMALRRGRRGERIAAAREIGDLAIAHGMKIPEAVVPLSVTLSTDKDPAVRQEAAWSLWKLSDSRAHAPLIRALLVDGSTRVRERAARALGLLGANEALPAMLRLLRLEKHIPARLRAGIACAMGFFASESVLARIEEAALDPEPYVRYEAVRSLGRFLVGFPEEISDRVLSILRGYLRPSNEPSASIRQAAIKAMRFSSCPLANESVARALTSDPHPAVREAAAEALLLWKGAASEAALIDALSDDHWPVRKAAARALARSIKRHGVHDSARISEALRRLERMLPAHSHEWRLAADAFASL